VTLTEEFGTPVINLASTAGIPISFSVDIACSGLYSLIGFLVFAFFLAYVTREKLLKKTVIFLVGLPLIYLLNVMRIIIIIVLGYNYGMDLALQVFHLIGGWVLIFLQRQNLRHIHAIHKQSDSDKTPLLNQ